MFDMFEVRKVLIIGPLRVARDTWPSEIEKWEHLRHLRYSVAVGSAEETCYSTSSRCRHLHHQP